MEGNRGMERSESIYGKGSLEDVAQLFADELKKEMEAAGETFDPQKIEDWVLNAMVETQTKAEAENRTPNDDELTAAALDAIYPEMIGGEKARGNVAKRHALELRLMAKHEKTRLPGIGREFPQ